MRPSSPSTTAANAATTTEDPMTSDNSDRTTDPFGPPAVTPVRLPDDPSAYGRRVGAAFRADPANAPGAEALAWAARLGLGRYDPDDVFGAGYRVFCGIGGDPADPDERDPYPLSRLPREVVDFWAEQITDVRSRTEVMAVADDPGFAAAFVAAVTE